MLNPTQTWWTGSTQRKHELNRLVQVVMQQQDVNDRGRQTDVTWLSSYVMTHSSEIRFHWTKPLPVKWKWNQRGRWSVSFPCTTLSLSCIYSHRMISVKLQTELAHAPRPYLDGGWFDEANSLNIVHDPWKRLKRLQKGAAGIRNGPLLPFLLQVVHKDVVILFPVEELL